MSAMQMWLSMKLTKKDWFLTGISETVAPEAMKGSTSKISESSTETSKTSSSSTTYLIYNSGRLQLQFPTRQRRPHHPLLRQQSWPLAKIVSQLHQDLRHLGQYPSEKRQNDEVGIVLLHARCQGSAEQIVRMVKLICKFNVCKDCVITLNTLAWRQSDHKSS